MDSPRSQTPTASRRQAKATVRGLFSRDRSAVVTQPIERPCGTPASTAIVPVSTVGRHLHRRESARQKPWQEKTTWDPPPLFQAYPQSLQHAILDVSCLAPEVILRKSQRMERNPPQDSSDMVFSQGSNPLVKRRQENAERPRRKLSASVSTGGWTKKLFVLGTSGYLLQYAIHGNHDRLPEKLMQLGKDSVAFASDAIPGRHWVLQISQTAGHDAESKLDSAKGIWSRWCMQSTEFRRLAKSFLLIFDTPEKMEGWLIAVRKEIEALGGGQYRRRQFPVRATYQVHGFMC